VEAVQHEGEQKESPVRARLLASSRARVGRRTAVDSGSAAADLMSATAGSTSAAVDSSSAAAESTLRRYERRWCAMEQRADGDAGGGAHGDGLRGAEAAVRLRES